MAHFARIEEGVVRQVIVINNQVLKDENGIEQESIGAQFCADTFGGEWVQTSYNRNFRGKYAASGDIYDAQKDEFISSVSTEEEVTE
ncbi:MAG: hypothetical protein EBU08_11120 [Micrococcales bacterium]|nr:hypothetical protein [Micrococcales bacterium]